MGLGKTIQAIAYMLGIRSLRGKQCLYLPFLVVCPLSTLVNWRNELKKWAPDFNVVEFAGAADGRAQIERFEFANQTVTVRTSQGTRGTFEYPPHVDVVITNYEIASLERIIHSRFKWEALIVDEGHRLKKTTSRNYERLNRVNSEHRLILSGTPIQNNLDEFFALFEFLQYDLHDVRIDFDELTNESKISALREFLQERILHRLKEDVFKELPKRRYLYKNILLKNTNALVAPVNGSKDTISISNVLAQLLKIVNHPFLIQGVEQPAQTKEEEFTQLVNTSSTNVVVSCTDKSHDSAKLALLNKMLPKLKDEGHKVVLFSRFTHTLDIIEDFLVQKGPEYTFLRLDGSTPTYKRDQDVERFNTPGDDTFVFLISTKAGGIGLNLHTADTVILYDFGFNPQDDEQAIGRVHRIKQKKDVVIYRFVTRKSVEEGMLEMQKRKIGLQDALIFKTLSKHELFSILRHGARLMLEDDLVEDGDDKALLEYDEAKINSLLDRKLLLQQQQQGEESSRARSILQKITQAETVQTPTKGRNEEEMFWEAFNAAQADMEEQEMGRGKRRRVQLRSYTEGESKKRKSSLPLKDSRNSKKQKVRGPDHFGEAASDESEFQTDDAMDGSSSPSSSVSSSDEHFDSKVSKRPVLTSMASASPSSAAPRPNLTSTASALTSAATPLPVSSSQPLGSLLSSVPSNSAQAVRPAPPSRSEGARSEYTYSAQLNRQGFPPSAAPQVQLSPSGNAATSSLRPPTPHTLKAGDRIMANGVEYQVMSNGALFPTLQKHSHGQGSRNNGASEVVVVGGLPYSVGPDGLLVPASRDALERRAQPQQTTPAQQDHPQYFRQRVEALKRSEYQKAKEERAAELEVEFEEWAKAAKAQWIDTTRTRLKASLERSKQEKLSRGWTEERIQDWEANTIRIWEANVDPAWRDTARKLWENKRKARGTQEQEEQIIYERTRARLLAIAKSARVPPSSFPAPSPAGQPWQVSSTPTSKSTAKSTPKFTFKSPPSSTPPTPTPQGPRGKPVQIVDYSAPDPTSTPRGKPYRIMDYSAPDPTSTSKGSHGMPYRIMDNSAPDPTSTSQSSHGNPYRIMDMSATDSISTSQGSHGMPYRIMDLSAPDPTHSFLPVPDAPRSVSDSSTAQPLKMPTELAANILNSIAAPESSKLIASAVATRAVLPDRNTGVDSSTGDVFEASTSFSLHISDVMNSSSAIPTPSGPQRILFRTSKATNSQSFRLNPQQLEQLKSKVLQKLKETLDESGGSSALSAPGDGASTATSDGPSSDAPQISTAPPNVSLVSTAPNSNEGATFAPAAPFSSRPALNSSKLPVASPSTATRNASALSAPTHTVTVTLPAPTHAVTVSLPGPTRTVTATPTGTATTAPPALTAFTAVTPPALTGTATTTLPARAAVATATSTPSAAATAPSLLAPVRTATTTLPAPSGTATATLPDTTRTVTATLPAPARTATATPPAPAAFTTATPPALTRIAAATPTRTATTAPPAPTSTVTLTPLAPTSAATTAQLARAAVTTPLPAPTRTATATPSARPAATTAALPVPAAVTTATLPVPTADTTATLPVPTADTTATLPARTGTATATLPAPTSNGTITSPARAAFVPTTLPGSAALTTTTRPASTATGAITSPARAAIATATPPAPTGTATAALPSRAAIATATPYAPPATGTIPPPARAAVATVSPSAHSGTPTATLPAPSGTATLPLGAPSGTPTVTPPAPTGTATSRLPAPAGTATAPLPAPLPVAVPASTASGPVTATASSAVAPPSTPSVPATAPASARITAPSTAPSASSSAAKPIHSFVFTALAKSPPLAKEAAPTSQDASTNPTRPST